MPSFIPRSSEPYKKRELFVKRVLQLRAAVNSGAMAGRLSNAAENVRLAALTVIKAKRAMIRGNDRVLQLRNLQQKEKYWSALTVEEIVAQFSEMDRRRTAKRGERTSNRD